MSHEKTKIVAAMSDFRCTGVRRNFRRRNGRDRINSAHVSEEAPRIVEIVHRVNPAILIMIDTKARDRGDDDRRRIREQHQFRAGDRVAVRFGRFEASPPARWST